MTKFRHLDIFDDCGEVSLNIITDIEEAFGIKFPKSYIDLITKHNGVYFEQDTFEYDKYEKGDQEGYNDILFHSFKTETYPEPSENIWAQYIYDDPIHGYENVFSFGRSADGNFICFDYREDPTGDEPKICIVIHDEFDEETGKRLLCPITNTFDEFLDCLFKDD